jgi:predicted nucleic acid-binding protein
LERKPFWEAAEQLLLLEDLNLVLQLTSSAVTDIYYIMRKLVGDAATREYLASIFDLFEILDVTSADCRTALMLPMKDFEDALQAICARKAKCSYIITRDEQHYEGAPVPAVTPERFLEEALWTKP